MICSGLTAHLIWVPATFRLCSQHFTLKLWLPQMLPNFGYGRQIMPTDVKKQGLPQMSENRPNIGSTGYSWYYDTYMYYFLETYQLYIYIIYIYMCGLLKPAEPTQLGLVPLPCVAQVLCLRFRRRSAGRGSTAETRMRPWFMVCLSNKSTWNGDVMWLVWDLMRYIINIINLIWVWVVVREI